MIHSIQILHNVDWNPLLTQTGFVLQLLETYKISLNKFDIPLGNASTSINYRLLKDYFGMKEYFEILDNKNVVELCRVRIANNKLPIEIGR